MAKEILGHITCPHCKSDEATVHQAAGRNKAFYYRCYSDTTGGCGTIQISLTAGQKFIKENMRPLNKIEVKQAAEVAANDASISQVKAAKKVVGAENTDNETSFFAKFFEDEDK